MPKFNKSTGFQLKSGNTVRSIGSPFFKGNSTPPTYYKSPLEETKAYDAVDETDKDKNKTGSEEVGNEEKTTEKTATETTADGTEVEVAENKEKDDVKENVEPDKPGTKAWKIAANALIGGMDAVYGTKTKRPKINFAKKTTEVEDKSSEQKVDELIGKPAVLTQEEKDAGLSLHDGKKQSSIDDQFKDDPNSTNINNANQMNGGKVNQENEEDD